jgi:anti-sigma factor RsiW
LRIMFLGAGSRRCRKVRRLLTEYIDGRLSSHDVAFVERHIETCAGCSEELESLRATVRLLNRVPSVPVPRSFALREADVAQERAVPRRRGVLRPLPVPVPVGPGVGGAGVLAPERLRWLRPATAVVAAALVLLIALDFAHVVPQEGRANLERQFAPQVMAPANDTAVFGQVGGTLKANGSETEDIVPPPAPVATGASGGGGTTLGDRNHESLGVDTRLDQTERGWPMRQMEIGFGAVLLAMVALTLVVWRRRRRWGTG